MNWKEGEAFRHWAELWDNGTEIATIYRSSSMHETSTGSLCWGVQWYARPYGKPKREFINPSDMPTLEDIKRYVEAKYITGAHK